VAASRLVSVPIPLSSMTTWLTLNQGEVLALMGPSGSGKTTLLNVLAGRVSATKGSVLVDELRVSAPDYKKLTSFVEQEDILMGCLTVRETLDFAARLSLPR
jgi:ABC-type multidrug transport system ATPase subunit